MKPDKPKFSKLKRRFYKHLWLFRPLSYLLIITIIILFFIWFTPKLKTPFKKIIKGPAAVVSLINPGINNLLSFKDRTNILLLGAGGGDHPGGDLTDSIMLISINLISGDTVIISLPRDIWVESLSSKLNTAYHFGEGKKPGGGLVLVKSAVSEIINQPIHYAVMLDFSGFEEGIDTLGGINLNVPHGFIDEKYPVPGKEDIQPESDRYEKLEFLAGEQHMDGATALKYVRSRNAEGIEGTDYARSQRQQRVILSFKDELLSIKNILNFKKIKILYQIYKNSVKTDFPAGAYSDVFKLSFKIDKDNIRTGIIDQGSENEDIPALLYNPPTSLYGQWVLIPINNDWQAVYNHVEEILYQNQ